MRATTDMQEAADCSYAVHAVPVQHSRSFLESIKDVLPPHVPIVCVSKGLEVGSGCMMSEVIPSALGRRQPATFISGPSFAREVMEGRPTGVVAASKDGKLARQVQQLFASPSMRVNTSTDVIGEPPASGGLWGGEGGGWGERPTSLWPGAHT
jgi:glycerol-3-phosphate dehydrogenase (NAD+)